MRYLKISCFEVSFYYLQIKIDRQYILQAHIVMALYSVFSIQERKSFTGNWINGKREGPGKMIWLNGEEYNGEWKNNLQVYLLCVWDCLEQKLMQISFYNRDARAQKSYNDLPATYLYLLVPFFALFLPPPAMSMQYVVTQASLNTQFKKFS